MVYTQLLEMHNVYMAVCFGTLYILISILDKRYQNSYTPIVVHE